MDIIVAVVIAVAGIIVASVFGLVLHKKQLAATFEDAQAESKKVLEEARKEADRMVRDAIRESKDENRNRRQKLEEEGKERRAEIAKLENKTKQRERNLDKKFEIIDKKEQDLDSMGESLREEESRYKRLVQECEKTLEQSRRTLQNIAGMSPEEAKRQLVKSMEDEAKKNAQELIREIEENAKREGEERARSMVSLAVQRISSEYVNESAVSVVSIPSDDMKGRIIGREGRNIRAIETSTGVDLIIDDTPEAIIISSFNPVRREIAKISITRLVQDGRIHPARIEETVQRVKDEFDQTIIENGEQACFDAGITDLHPELIKRLGVLRYRSAGQQTVLQHSLEVAHICAIMASEMGLNVKKAKRAGLLHDIGKSVDQEVEGHHSHLGAELCSKYEEPEEVTRAIRDHHNEEVTHLSPYGVIVHAANSLSANRPGARKELLESYVKRLGNMEEVVKGFDGIQEAFVMQAGREIRAMVTPSGVSDHEIVDLSQNIASKLRSELTFPGQVRVTVVRESKYSDYAK